MSLEYLLREKLEKMVGAEVRERMEAFQRENGGGRRPAESAETESLSQGLREAEDEVRTLRSRLAAAEKRARDAEKHVAERKSHDEKNVTTSSEAELRARLADSAEKYAVYLGFFFSFVVVCLYLCLGCFVLFVLLVLVFVSLFCF